MIRRVNRYKDTKKVYYICSTKNRGDGCTRHSIEEKQLSEIVKKTIVVYANTFMNQSRLFESIKNLEVNFDAVSQYDKEMNRLRLEQDKYYKLCSGLYEDLGNGIITKRDFERLHTNYTNKLKEIANALVKQEELVKQLFKKGILVGNRLEVFKRATKLDEEEIDRRTLVSLVKSIHVYEDKRIEIEFNFIDEYEAMLCVNKTYEEDLKHNQQLNSERSA